MDHGNNHNNGRKGTLQFNLETRQTEIAVQWVLVAVAFNPQDILYVRYESEYLNNPAHVTAESTWWE